jgi:hypothetical protein
MALDLPSAWLCPTAGWCNPSRPRITLGEAAQFESSQSGLTIRTCRKVCSVSPLSTTELLVVDKAKPVNDHSFIIPKPP